MAAPHFHLFPVEDQIVSRVGRAFGHPARIAILRLLLKRHESSFGLICESLPLARQTILQHLNYLMDHGFVEVREVPPFTYYRLTDEVSRDLFMRLYSTLNVFLEDL
jgi:DNA-binding transcriptional ArsR family regulator